MMWDIGMNNCMRIYQQMLQFGGPLKHVITYELQGVSWMAVRH